VTTSMALHMIEGICMLMVCVCVGFIVFDTHSMDTSSSTVWIFKEFFTQ
jgi:hypothetical protein